MEYHNKWLSNKWVRYINYTILIILMLAYFVLGVYEIWNPLCLVISIFVSLFYLHPSCFEEQMRSIRWSEWDVSERTRKLFFIHSYTILNLILSFLTAYSFSIAALVIDYTETSLIDGRFIVSGWYELDVDFSHNIINGYSVLIPPIILLINTFFTLSLFFPIFKDRMPRPQSKLSPKPEYWQDSHFY